jgi:hypothetical protein
MKTKMFRLLSVLLCAVLFSTAVAYAAADPDPGADPPQSPSAPPQTHPAATTFSHGYEVRRNIHRYASFATLPLFATELALGQSLYNSSSQGGAAKGAHAAVGTGLIGLFGINTFTGVWNMVEARKDPQGRALRMTHGILMIAANAGFVATAATAPGGRRFGTTTFNNQKATHRDVAYASIGVGTAGYLLMLFKKH